MIEKLIKLKVILLNFLLFKKYGARIMNLVGNKKGTLMIML